MDLYNHTIIGIYCPFVHLSVPHLLRHLRTDRDQTWHECRGWVDLEPKGIGYHGNQCAAMVTKNVVFEGQISHEINGRKVGDSYGKDLMLLVSMATDMLP